MSNVQKQFEGIANGISEKYGMHATFVGAITTDGKQHMSLKDCNLNQYFHIGSVSKTVLALLALKLIDEGIIEDIKVTEYYDVHEDYNEVSLLSLLSFRGGVRAFTNMNVDHLPKCDDCPDSFFGEELSKPSKQKKDTNRHLPYAIFEPFYSNLSYAIASDLMCRKLETTYEDLLAKYYPDLEIKYGWPMKLGKGQLYGHFDDDGEDAPHMIEDGYKLHPMLKPAGDICLKPLDLMKLLEIHVKGLHGKSSFANARVFEQMHSTFEGIGFGVVRWRASNGEMVTSMDGSLGTFYTSVYFDKKRNLGLVTTCNTFVNALHFTEAIRGALGEHSHISLTSSVEDVISKW